MDNEYGAMKQDGASSYMKIQKIDMMNHQDVEEVN